MRSFWILGFTILFLMAAGCIVEEKQNPTSGNDTHADNKTDDQYQVNPPDIVVNASGQMKNISTVNTSNGTRNEPVTYLSAERGTIYAVNNTWTYFNKGRLLFDKKEYRDAIPFFERAISLDQRNAVAYYFLGTSLIETGRIQEAVRNLNISISVDNSSPGAFYELGRAYEQLNQPVSAMMYYQRASELDPSNAWIRYNNGRVLISQKEFTKAIAELNESIGIDPCKAPPYYEQSVGYYELGRYDDARRAIEAAIDRDFLSSQYRLYRQKVMLALDPDLWNPEYQRTSLVNQTRNVSAWFNLGKIQYSLGEYDKAVASLNHSVELEPDNSSGWYYRGMARYELGQYPQAACDFDMVLLLDPGNAWAYYYRGDILHRLSQCQYAFPYLNKAIQLDPSIPWTYYVKGNCYFNSSRYKQAADNYNLSLSHFPCNEWAWYYGALSLYNLGDYPDALKYINKALSYDPSNRDFLKWKADILSENGNPDEAIFLNNLSLPNISATSCPGCATCG